eukprot:CAMPEP_0172166746 /NCGR_PEP_ID=MMETSP1050-20130122/9170_1 /TAXON_ID=233186 /ORGANISM="Cryptomonas curvata, Strain CCAP979/52" /LENGTH=427 /DNA_ID=CAMNT_0012837425 /DNA_START=206 /DNA_END=1487 /DNA_ORIENTATION=-
MDDQVGKYQSSRGCWKPHLLQISKDNLLFHIDDTRELKQRCNLPFFQEWLALRRILRTADSTSGLLDQGSFFSLDPSEIGLTCSPNFPSCNASDFHPSDSVEESRVGYKAVCGAAHGNNNSNVSSVTSSSTFVSLETAICPSETLDTLDRSSEIQKQVDIFCLESSKRIRDVILRRTPPENENKITKPESTRQKNRKYEEASINTASLIGLVIIDADDLPATNRAAGRIDLQEESSNSFRLVTSQASVAESRVHSYAKKFDLFVDRSPGPIKELAGLSSTTSLKSVSHAATQAPEPPEPVNDGKGFHLTYASRAEYAGELLNSLPHGEGRYLCSACSYRGEWLYGRPHGRGDYSWPDGDRYCGEFVDGKRSGYGIYYTWTGDKYAGTWINDELSGLGMCTQGDGRRLVLSPSKTHRTLTPHGSMLCW